MLFTQVYFHKTRVIYDYHLKEVLSELLKVNGTKLPAPDTKENIDNFLGWDDWRIYGALNAGKGGKHGERLKNRDHFRLVLETREIPSPEELEMIDSLEKDFSNSSIEYVRIPAGKSWYKTGGDAEIYVGRNQSSMGSNVRPLSAMSSVVQGFATIRQERIYVLPEHKKKAQDIVKTRKKELSQATEGCL
jgi:HD superfamily phosphohydrolase